MKNLKVIENGLIPIYQGKNGQLVDGRELHSFLEVGTKFSDWIKDRIDKYEFVEGIDFTSFPKKEKAENTWITTIEYVLTLDTAKEISMVQINEKGSQARKYFIEAEKNYKEMADTESIEDLIILQAKSIKDIKLQLQKARNEATAVSEAVKEMREVIAISPLDDWREQTNRLVAKVCKKLNSYDAPKEIIYKALQTRAKCDLKSRLENKIRRLIREGVTKSKAEKLNYLDVIADDRKLIEIYTAIVKEMAIKNKVI